jgi:hypothetical protein
MDIIEQIKKLAELKDQGILTEEEFQQQKTKLLNSTYTTQKQAIKPSILEELSDLDYNSQPPQKKRTIYQIFKLIFFITMTFIVINIVNNAYKEYENNKTQNFEVDTQQSGTQIQNPQPEVININILELAKEYSANEVKTDEKYKNKLINISGNVNAISKDFTDSLVLELISDNPYLPANMSMEPSEKSKMMNLTKDEAVIVQCKKTSYIMNSPTGYNCILLSN